MDSGHQTFDDTKVVIDDLSEGSQAVGSAGGIGDDLVFRLVGVQVDTADEHGSVSRRGRDDDLLGATDQVGLGLLGGGEDTSGFNDIGSFILGPWDLSRVAFGVDGDSLAINDELAILGLNGALVTAVGGVVLEHVDHVFQVDEGVVDGNNLDIGVLERGTEDNAANTTETRGCEAKLTSYLSFDVVKRVTYPLIPTLTTMVGRYIKVYENKKEQKRKKMARKMDAF